MLEAKLWILLILVYDTMSLRCWTRTCEDEDWCIQECGPQHDICYGSYRINGSEITPDLFLCQEDLENTDCLNTRCELDLTDTHFSGRHACCCREDLCNVIDNIVDGVTASPQGTVPTPSGTPPPHTTGVICEVYSSMEHIFMECNHCFVTYKLNADMEYALDEKQCLDAPPPSQSCDQECVLDTSGTASDISCCCSGYLCNEYSTLEFTDPTKVSMYVHQSQCDNVECNHSCAVVNGNATCFCTQGFALLMDGTCEDIDECRMSPCSHICTNFDGGFRCSCPIGLKLGEDGVTCEDAGLQCWRYSRGLHPIIQSCSVVLETLGVQYEYVSACKALYVVANNSTLILVSAECFAYHVDNPCQSGNNCILEPSFNNPSLYSCCCTTSLCIGNQTLPRPGLPTTSPTTTPTGSYSPNITTGPTSDELESLPVKISLGVAASILFIIIIILVILCCCCKYRKRNRIDGNIVIECPLNDMIVTDETILLENEIGHGRFSVVYSGTRSGAKVAVKCFDVKENFTKELSIYQTENFNHKNVLKDLTHVSSAKEKKFWIVFEFHARGSLYSVLRRSPVSLREFGDIAASTACGLAYLHNETVHRGRTIKPCIAHRDLKSKNILIKDNGECCISDFGLSVRFPLANDKEGHGQVGTARYMAPEVLEGSILFSRLSYKQIDCYSLGVILYEVMTRTKVNEDEVPPYSPPFEDKVGPNPTVLDMKRLVINEGFRPEIPGAFCKNAAYDPLVELVQELWDSTANARPTAEAAYGKLSTFKTVQSRIGGGIDIETPSVPTIPSSMTSLSLPHPAGAGCTEHTV